jgi:hypothetical protein
MPHAGRGTAGSRGQKTHKKHDQKHVGPTGQLCLETRSSQVQKVHGSRGAPLCRGWGVLGLPVIPVSSLKPPQMNTWLK